MLNSSNVKNPKGNRKTSVQLISNNWRAIGYLGSNEQDFELLEPPFIPGMFASKVDKNCFYLTKIGATAKSVVAKCDHHCR